MTNRLDGGLADQLEKLLTAAGEQREWTVDRYGAIWGGDDFISFDTKGPASGLGWPHSDLIAFLLNNAPTFLSALQPEEAGK